MRLRLPVFSLYVCVCVRVFWKTSAPLLMHHLVGPGTEQRKQKNTSVNLATADKEWDITQPTPSAGGQHTLKNNDQPGTL